MLDKALWMPEDCFSAFQLQFKQNLRHVLSSCLEIALLTDSLCTHRPCLHAKQTMLFSHGGLYLT